MNVRSVGVEEELRQRGNYEDTVRQMIRTETLLDTGMLYFDARLSQHYPALEIRIARLPRWRSVAVVVGRLYRRQHDARDLGRPEALGE